MKVKVQLFKISSVHDTVVEIKDWQNAILWSKTTQTTGSVDGIWEDSPTCKMGAFFLMSLTLTEPILKKFQSNRDGWQTRKQKFPLFTTIKAEIFVG